MSILAGTDERVVTEPGSSVRAATERHVREQFTKRYVIGDDDAKKVADAKRKAFNRALEKLPLDFGAGEHSGQQWIWRT